MGKKKMGLSYKWIANKYYMKICLVSEKFILNYSDEFLVRTIIPNNCP